MQLILIGSIVLTVLLLGIWIYLKTSTYNKLIKLRNKTKNSWAHIDAQLQRRFDLIPNLVEIVKGYTTHEKQIIESVLKIQKDFLNAQNNDEKIEMYNQLSSQLKLLYTNVDNYPELRSNQNFLQLQRELTEIEEDIALARQFYNDAVTIYNNQLMMFPNNMFARKYGFVEEKLFDAVQGADVAPRIRFKTRQSNTCINCGATLKETDIECPYCGRTCD